MKYIFLFIILCFVFMFQTTAQMVGTHVYLKGNYIEIGINGDYGHEGVNIITSPVPSGYIYRGTANIYGVYANPQMDGWINYDGDFISPGSPENGWGFEVISSTSVSSDASNNCATSQEMSGSITSYSSASTFTSTTGVYNYALSGYDLSFEITYILGMNDHYYTTRVKVTNNGTLAIPELYYYKNMDPDNNTDLGGGFTTTNSILSQPIGSVTRAQVVAEQSTPWPSVISMIGEGNNFRVSKGGFTNRDGSDIWNAAGGLSGSVGAISVADEAISIGYKITGLAPGASEVFEFYTVFADWLLDNDFVSSSINYSGAGNLIDGLEHDTVTACAPFEMELMGLNRDNFTWQWMPSTYLDIDTGTVVNCMATDTITYTVIGTPTGSLDPDTLYVTVLPTLGPQIAFVNPSPLCNSYELTNLVYSDINAIPGSFVTYHTLPPSYLGDNEGMFNDTIIHPNDTLFMVMGDSITGCYDVEPLSVVWSDVIFTLDYTTSACTSATAIVQLADIISLTGEYDVLWSTGDTTEVVSGVDTGWVSVAVTDSSGCLTTDSALIGYNNFTYELIMSPEGCNLTNGTIEVINLSDSTGTYTFDWSNGDSEPLSDSLDGGFYSVTVTNQDGCATTDTITVPDLVSLFGLDVAIFDATCATCANGTINLFYSGSPVLPLTYVWSTGATTPNIFALLPGTYFVTVTDSIGCSYSDTFFVNYPIGVDEINMANQVKVYPVPVFNQLSIESSEIIAGYKLFSADGKLIKSEALNTKATTLDFLPYANGVYTLEITIGNNLVRKRVVK